MAGFAWQTLGYIPIPQIGNSVARGFVTGGVRRYRGTMSSRLFASTIQQSGAADALGQLFCVGAATPTATWSQYLRFRHSDAMLRDVHVARRIGAARRTRRERLPADVELARER